MAKMHLKSSTMYVGENFENFNFYDENENIFLDFPRLFHQNFQFSLTSPDFH